MVIIFKNIMAGINQIKSSATEAVQSRIERGALDTWPVHSLLPQNYSTSVDKPSFIPKPKFLQQLENHLEKELLLLGCPSQGPHELRLQAHQEVFEYLIEEFKTYKPLLSAIKNEYDLFITHQNDLIRELLPLQSQVYQLKDEYEKKMLATKEEEKKRDDSVRQEYRYLQSRMEKMKEEEASYQAQIKKLQSELSDIYEQYRNEADARKLLISDYNELKVRQSEDQDEEETIEKEDPVILKLKLARAREDLRASNLRINQMLADYGDVVPRREFEMMETSYRTQESELENLKSQHTSLMEEHSTLLVMYKDLQIQRDRSLTELTRIKGTATPRPDWSRCGEFIEGGPDKWAEISEGRSSNELVDVLLAQIAGVDISELKRHEVFQAQGLSTDVPRYLRAEGQIRNHRMGRQEMEETISGFWEYHSTKAAKGNGHHDLDTELYQYLLSRNGDEESIAIENGYNIQDAISRFHHELHVSTFSSILCGELMEEIYNNWISIQVALMETFKKTTDQECVTLAVLEDAIKCVCPGKPEPYLKGLIQCAVHVASDGNNTINIIKLMSKGPQSQPNPFVTLMLEQSRNETKIFVTELNKHLGDKQMVTLKDVHDAVKNMDPNKPEAEIQLILSKIFSVPLGHDDSSATLPLEKLVSLLEASDIRRSGL